MLSLSEIQDVIYKVVKEYPVKKVSLFGSYANETFTEKSDIDILVEFLSPSVSLLTISSLKIHLQEELGKDVDIIHAPIAKNSLIDIGKAVSIYES